MSVGSRIFLDKSAPSVFEALTATASRLREHATAAGVDRRLLELVNVRVSQLNRCVYCLDLHSRQALAAGVTPQRLAVLPGWRDTALFDDRERAALEIADAVTLLAGDRLDAGYDRARSALSDDETSLLAWAAITINAFNRVSIMSGHPVAERDGAGRVVTPRKERDT